MSIPKPDKSKFERVERPRPKPMQTVEKPPLPTYVPMYQRNPAVWSKEFPEDVMQLFV